MATRPTYRPPYDELFIYYLEGHITSSAQCFGAAFIGNWEEEGDTFLFFRQPADALVQHLTDHAPGLVLRDRFRMSYEEWQGGRLNAFRVGPFLVHTPWTPDAPVVRPDDLAILIDPGVVFGAGNHPTTHDCLAALAWLSTHGRVASALDLGTGTGILAVAAARIGCRRVLAVDFNRLATETAKRNVMLNDATDCVWAIQGRAEELASCPAELLMANIHYDVMQRILAAPGFADRRYAILSGLLRSQAREIETLLARRALPVLRHWTHDDIWHTYLVQCRPDLALNLQDGADGLH